MKKVTLKKLILENWRGQNKTVEFSKNTEIKGRNKSGKSTIFNAFLWVLTSSDELDRTNFRLFDETLELTYENSKIASVESIIDIDGIEYNIKKTAKQGWARVKGASEYTKKNTDDYKFYLDLIELSATEFKNRIEEMFAPVDKLKIMLNMYQLLRMDWKSARKQFEELIGEIKESDFKGDYSCISALMTKFNNDIENVKANIKPQIKKLKEDVGTPNVQGKLEIEIDVLKSTLPDVSGLDKIQSEINETKKRIDGIDKRLLGDADAIKPLVAKRDAELAKIDTLKREYQEVKSAYELKPIEEANKIKIEIASIALENEQISKKNKQAVQVVEDAKRGLVSAKNRLKTYNEYRQVLLEQNEEVKSLQFTEETCPYCKQMLPQDKLEEAKKKFFEQRDAKHKSIVAEGKRNNEDIAKAKNEISELEAVITKGYEEAPLKSANELEQKLADLRKNFVPYNKTIEGSKKVSEIESLTANLTIIPQQDNTALVNMKKSLLDKIEELSKQLNNKSRYDEQMDIINHKQEELRNSGIQLALLEKEMDAAVQYEREKAAIIKCRLEGMFNYISVVMQSKTKDGSLVDDCRIIDAQGIDSNVTNTASRMLCGIDIMLGVQKHFGLSLPIFIDDADLINESNMPNMDNQIVKLIVSESDFEIVNV